ncbi:hypothetical protein [Croceicoccus marinus]|uniref:hypothetical protein n=1 Tax=Croceicoccus marinus TaxID=450378 RepID=UPI001E508077|nr:hypothetical protein [Croceicoccus marinus]
MLAAEEYAEQVHVQFVPERIQLQVLDIFERGDPLFLPRYVEGDELGRLAKLGGERRSFP